MINRIKYKILWLTVIFAWVCSYSGFAQDSSGNKYFIYIQNEEGTPFYVKKDNSVLSSTPAGYMIIPQLTKGKYQLTIGLPGNKVPEASFDINMPGPDDKGFLLKSGGDKLNLYSLKDLRQIAPVAVASAAGNRIVNVPVPSDAPKKQTATPDNGNDALAVATDQKPGTQNEAPAANDNKSNATGNGEFAKMLNEITGKDKPPATTTSKKEQPEANEDTNSSAAAADKKQEIANQPASVEKPQGQPAETETIPAPAQSKPAKEEPAFITFIPDKAQKNTPVSNTPTDQAVPDQAVKEVKPPEEPAASNPVQKPPVQEESHEQQAVNKPAPASEDSSSDNDFEAALKAAESTVQHTQIARVDEKENTDKRQIQSIPNSDCKNRAGEEDFQKIRRKMASRSDQEGMYRIAEKYFKGGICYTAAQIKSLTYLFSADEYKYKFLELAYPHVYDTSHFPALVKTMSDEYYRGRFNALIGK